MPATSNWSQQVPSLDSLPVTSAKSEYRVTGLPNSQPTLPVASKSSSYSCFVTRMLRKPRFPDKEAQSVYPWTTCVVHCYRSLNILFMMCYALVASFIAEPAAEATYPPHGPLSELSRKRVWLKVKMTFWLCGRPLDGSGSSFSATPEGPKAHAYNSRTKPKDSMHNLYT